MNKEKIKTYLLDFQEKKFSNIRKRDIILPDTAKIQTIIGARRTGKTYLLYNKILELEERGIPRKQIIYLNFENPVLDDLSYKEIRDIIALQWSLFPEIAKKRMYIFIDEPQAIDKWEAAIRDLHDNFNARIFITGSSSRLLSKEIATNLRGRSISTLLLPLSFKEFLSFNGFAADIVRLSTENKAYLLNYFDKYLAFGAYPEVVLSANKEEKIKILKDYFDLTIYKDLVDRYKIKNTALIKNLIDMAVGSCAREFSVNKHYLDFKSRGLKAGKNTLYEYFSMLEDSFFIFPLRRFSHSKTTENLSIPKVYLGDMGFLNLYSLENFGQRLENAVFLALRRKIAGNPALALSYWKSDAGEEVDFILREGRKIKSVIQVSYEMPDNKTETRELNGLLSCLDEMSLDAGLIIARDAEAEKIIGGKTVKIISAWRWLLLNSAD